MKKITNKTMVGLSAFCLAASAFSGQVHAFTFFGFTKASVEDHALIYRVDLPGHSDSGTRWVDAFAQAASNWSSVTPVNVQVEEGSADPCQVRDPASKVGHVGLSETLCNDQSGSNNTALATTITYRKLQSVVAHSNIVYDPDRLWDVYDGPSRTRLVDNPQSWPPQVAMPVADFRRVSLHEIGHSLGLGHSAFPKAILSNASDRDRDMFTLTEDDICGVNIQNGNPQGCSLLLPNPVTLSGQPTSAMFVGGASKDQGETYDSVFSRSDVIDVMATVVAEDAHQLQQGRLHTIIELSDGAALMRTDGGFAPWDGSVEALRSATSSQRINGANEIYVLKDFDLTANNISNLGVAVYVGYSLDSNPNEIYFSGTPIQFRIE